MSGKGIKKMTGGLLGWGRIKVIRGDLFAKVTSKQRHEQSGGLSHTDI